MIVTEIRLMAGVHAHLERSTLLRAEDELKPRVESVTGAGLEIKLTSPPGILGRPHIQHIRLEAVGSLVRLLKHLIVKVQVEAEQRVRHVHPEQRLVNLRSVALIGVGDLDGRIEILSERDRGGHQHCRGNQIYLPHIHFHYIMVLSFSRRILTLSSTSSDVPSAGL